jgi:hypothetical protein
MSNTKKIEYDFYFKPVLLGSIVKSTITIIKNERN